MPIPTLKMKSSRRIPDEADSSTQKNTMLPRATKLHTGAGAGGPVTHMTSHIPSPYQGHREGRQTRQGGAASKMATRMNGGVPGPRPPPRTTSTLKLTHSPKQSALDKPLAAHSNRSPTKPVAATRAVSGKVPNLNLQQSPQQPLQQTSVCGSNRSSVISNCSSNPAPSSSSSNRNSSSSIGSSFSVGSWNGNCESGETHDSDDKRPISGTFPRVKNIRRISGIEDNIPRQTVDRSKLRMPNSYAQKNMNLHLKNRLVSKPLSSSDSSIIGRPRTAFVKPNLSDPNLVETNCPSRRFNSRVRNRTEKQNFCLPAPPVDTDSSDSDDIKNHGFRHPKMVRDVKYKKENVATVTPFQPVTLNRPVSGSESESTLKPAKKLGKLSPEDDDGYSSVALNDQVDEDEKYDKNATIYNDVAIPVKPMRPLKLMGSYSYFKCVGNNGQEISPSVNMSANPIPTAYREETSTKCPQDVPAVKSKEESNTNNLYDKFVSSVKEPAPYSSATVPKNVKFSSKTDCFSITGDESQIDESVYGVSYQKLVNSRAEIIKKQTEPIVRNVRKFGVADFGPKKSIETGRLYNTRPCGTLQNRPINREVISRHPVPTGYSLRSDISSISDSESNRQLFNRTKSLRFASPKDVKRELFPEQKSGVSDLTAANTPFKDASFPRGANKYSTVIPRTSDGIKSRQNTQFSSFGVTCKAKEPQAETQRGDQHGRSPTVDKSSEVTNLKMELKTSHDQMNSLIDQLDSKTKLLSAYEHSLTNMTRRLQHLSSVVEQKDIHISELKKMVEKACLDGVCISSSYKAKKGPTILMRGPSMESLASVTSNGSMMSYFSTASSLFAGDLDNKEKKKKNWIRSSFSRAFKRKDKKKELEYDSSSDAEGYGMNSHYYTRSISEPFTGFSSLPASPSPKRNIYVSSQDHSDNETDDSGNPHDEIRVLRQSLREKDSALTESRLEALSSAHQIDGLKESLQRLSTEMSTLKPRNKVTSHNDGKNAETVNSERIKFNALIRHEDIVTKKVNVLIPNTFQSEDDPKSDLRPTLNIGKIVVSSITTWKELFNEVESSFTTHMSTIDTENCLGVDINSIGSLRVGNIVTTSSKETQELLPYGYFVGDVDWVQINLANHSENCMDELSYETLIPKQNLLKYASVLQENRRIILGGVDGTGKRYLAGKLAEVVIRRLGVQPSSTNIATFQSHKHTSQELSAYLCHINELCEARKSDLPLVIILESINSADDFLDLLSNSLKIPNVQCPYIIGTVRVSQPENYELVTSLSNFRWISLSSSAEASERLMQRICRRSALGGHSPEQESRLLTIFEWIPRCFKAINCVLATSSLDLIEPGAFLPLPVCLDAAQMWFSIVWKATVLPKILMAGEACSNSTEDLDTWKQLYACLREDLPWIVLPNSASANFPLAFKTIEASC